MILKGEVSVSRPYIFTWIGTEMIRTATKVAVHKSYGRLMQAIALLNNMARVFVTTVLSRPVDNEQAKPFLVDINWCITSLSVNQYNRTLGIRVKVIPVHLSFLRRGKLRYELYHNNLLNLNQNGVQLLKTIIFRSAGLKTDLSA